MDNEFSLSLEKGENIIRKNRCRSCGTDTGMFMLSQWVFGLIKRVHCMECVNKKLAKKK